MKSPRVLLFDIETAHNVLAKFDLREEYTNPNNILKERYVICAAWKWLGDKRTSAVSGLDDKKRFAADPNDDKHVMTKLREVLGQADAVVGHNSDKFDLRWVRTRMLAHGLPPLPPIISIDTLKIARRVFFFNSNRLDYLGKFLGFGGKQSTPAGLWLDALKGDPKAIRTMVRYNKRDVELLEDVFLKLRPHASETINVNLFGVEGCPRCGSPNVQSRGVHRALTQVYQRFACQDCGGWFRRAKAERDAASKSRVL